MELTVKLTLALNKLYGSKILTFDCSGGYHPWVVIFHITIKFSSLQQCTQQSKTTEVFFKKSHTKIDNSAQVSWETWSYVFSGVITGVSVYKNSLECDPYSNHTMPASREQTTWWSPHTDNNTSFHVCANQCRFFIPTENSVSRKL